MLNFITNFSNSLQKMIVVGAIFIAMIMQNEEISAYYQTPEFPVTLKCVGWTNPYDTTIVTGIMSIREWATNSIYIKDFSSSFREIYMPFRYKPEVGYNYVWLEYSVLRWEDYTSCGVDGYVEIFQYDTTNNIFSGFINFEPACYFAPRFRRVLGSFSYSEAKPELIVSEYHKTFLTPMSQLSFGMQFTMSDKAIENASIYCINPFVNSNNEILIGTTNENGILYYNYIIPQNATAGEYTFSFRAVKDTLQSSTIERIVSVLDSLQLFISASPSEKLEIEAGKEAKYSLNVIDDNNDNVENTEIYCLNTILSDKFVKIGNTNTEGKFDYSFKIPSNTNANDYTIKFLAKKTGFKTSQTIERMLTVLPSDLTMKVLPANDVEVAEKDSITYMIYIRNAENKPVGNVKVYVNNPVEKSGFKLIGVTDSLMAKLNYGYRFAENTEGEYIFGFVAEKEDISTDTIFRKVTVVKGIKCWSILDGALEFCIEGKGVWEPVPETTKLETTGTVLINDLVEFVGKIAIDTAQLGISCEGDFLVRDVPLPLGGVGTFSIASGKYELKILGKDGKLTDFINAYTDNLAGFKFKVNDIQLVGGRRAEGVKIGATITVPGIAVGCSEEGDEKNTEFEVKDFEIKRTGIEIGGFKVENLGFISFPNFCLSKLYGEYDSERDRLDFGANVKIPFGEVGAGIAFIGGELDSIGFRMEASFPPLFVIGTTTVGISGFFGHISGITQPNLEFELGGILSDITSEDLYKIDISGFFKTPSTIGMKGEANLFKDPFLKKWQMKGSIEGNIDFSIAQMELKGGLNIGTKDEEEYLLTTEGSLKYNMRQSKFSGYVSGTLDIPKLRDDWPFDWINATIGLPKKVDADARLLFGKSKVLWGEANLGTKIGKLRYVVDLNKNYDDDDFFFFERTPEAEIVDIGKIAMNGNTVEQIIINSALERLVIRITGESSVPTTQLITPSMIEYLPSDEYVGDIIYSVDSQSKKAFWTITKPEIGTWQIKVLSENQNTSISYYQFEEKPEFRIYTIQNLDEVDVYWGTSGLNSSGVVEIYLDENKSGEDGIFVASFNALEGYGRVKLSDTLQSCKYYLYAIYNNDNYSLSSYSNEEISNNKSILFPPNNITAKYVTNKEKCVVEWEPSKERGVVGYVIVGQTYTGDDIVLASASKNERKKEFDLDNFSNYKIKVYSYNADGLKGCASNPVDIIMSNNESYQVQTGFKKSVLDVFPNPTNDRINISCKIDKPTFVKIKIINSVGEVVATVVDNHYITEGIFSTTFDCKQLGSSVYMVVLQTNDGIITQKVQVIK